MRYFLTFLLCSILGASVYAQVGEISGIVKDEFGDGMPFVSVAIKEGSNIVKGVTTDLDGNYSIKPLNPGRYSVEFSFLGYKTSRIENAVVKADQTTTINQNMAINATQTDVVDVVVYKEKLIDKEETSSKQTISAKEINQLAARDIGTLASTTAGTFVEDEGDATSIRGSRGNGTVIYVNGVKTRSSALPKNAIEQMTVITGGVPARYGDGIGGVINITTKGPASEFHGGVEVLTSQFLDNWGYNLVAANLTGPIVKDKDGLTKLGFSLSGEFTNEKDPDPSAVGVPVLKGEVADSNDQFPLIARTDGQGLFYRAETFTEDDYERVAVKPNTERRRYTGVLNLDYRATDNVDMTLGGQVEYTRFNDWVEGYTLMNSENNGLVRDLNYRVFARMSHRLARTSTTTKDGDAKESNSAIQNAYYTLQLDYEKRSRIAEDENHGQDYFKYGHIGSFKQNFERLYETIDPNEPYITPEGREVRVGTRFLGFTPSGVDFTPGTTNPKGTNYTEQYYQFVQDDIVEAPLTMQDLDGSRALINGDRSELIHNIWFNTGRQFNFAGQYDNDQIRGQVTGAFDILKKGSSDANKHNIEFGFEFEQRIDRHFQINPLTLYTTARNLANTHITELSNDPTFVIQGRRFSSLQEANDAGFSFQDGDTIEFERRVNEAVVTNFARNIREQLGVGLDEYVFTDTISPDALSLGLFSADELYDNFGGISYKGYNHKGERLTGRTSFNEFFTARDEDGNFLREIPAYTPIYAAAFIQDKFQYKDITFNLGLRVDRFDANTKVLRDPFSLYKVNTKDEFFAENTTAEDLATNLSGDVKVYVDNTNAATSQQTIVGYRDGDRWFDANGNSLADGSQIANAGGGFVNPSLSDNTQNIRATDGSYDPNQTFEDYTPEYTFMPRLQFSFNLTDEALFFAHYDVLSQRPQDLINGQAITNRIFTSPADWLDFPIAGTPFVNNPALRPEKTIDFQLGFKQKVTESSAITLSTFYKEFKDLVQFTRTSFAFPKTYLTYGNLDFGTTKGFSIDYDLRRTKNIQMKMNYTLQFATGTGSSDETQRAIVNAGQPNLRVIAPLDNDARHTVNLVLDYRFGSGQDYDGPKVKDKNILENFGVNLQLQARSGTPYTQQRDANEQAFEGGRTNVLTKGNINSAREPAFFRANLKINKGFTFNIGGSDNERGKTFDLNVYLQVNNLLNTRNVTQVHRFTGNPDDDGFLASDLGQQQINSLNPQVRQSFIDLYEAKVNRPDYYTIPRSIRLGVEAYF